MPQNELSQGLRYLFEQFGARVSTNLRTLGVPESDLDDATQEVFIVAWKRLDDYRERGQARAWLYQICRRHVSDRLRTRLRRREELAESIAIAADPNQDKRVVNREELELGLTLLQALNSAQRDVFLLYVVEEFSMPEVAKIVGCPLQTAYSRLRSAQSRIAVLQERVRHGAKARRWSPGRLAT